MYGDEKVTGAFKKPYENVTTDMSDLHTLSTYVMAIKEGVSSISNISQTNKFEATTGEID